MRTYTVLGFNRKDYLIVEECSVEEAALQDLVEELRNECYTVQVIEEGAEI